MKLINFALLASITFYSYSIFADDSQVNAIGATAAPASGAVTASVVRISSDKKSIEVKEPNTQNDVMLALGKGAQDELAGITLSQGDEISIVVEQNNVISIKPGKRITVPVGVRLGYLLGSAAGLLIFSILALMLAGKRGLCNFRFLIIGEDNRYSNSKFQIAIWFFALITTYLATVLLRWCYAGGDYLQVDIPQHLLLLSGLSALTFAGAKAITTSKINLQNTQAEDVKQKPSAAKCNERGQPNFFRDLLQNDNNQVDFGDFQMLVVTLLAVGVYLLAVFQFINHIDVLKVITLPDVDTTILSTFGLGQGAYLTKKYAGDLGES